MQPVLVAVVYVAALVLALVLLFSFRVKWYWHVPSILAALAVGLVPPMGSWWPPDLVVGFVFVLLLVWGIGGLLPRMHHHTGSRSQGYV